MDLNFLKDATERLLNVGILDIYEHLKCVYERQFKWTSAS